MKMISDQRVAILAHHGVDQQELTTIREFLERAGVKTDTIATEGREVKGWEQHQWGIRLRVDKQISAVKPLDYDGVFIPGGPLHADSLRGKSHVIAFVKELFGAGKVVASIGHGVQVLISAGVLNGLKVSSLSSITADVRHCGALVQDDAITADNGVITARSGDQLDRFAQNMIDLLKTDVKQRVDVII